MRALASFFSFVALTTGAIDSLHAEEPPAALAPVVDPASRSLPPAPAAPSSEIRSPVMTTVGSIVSALGVGSLIAGGAVWADSESHVCEAEGLAAAFCGLDEVVPKSVAISLLVAGGAHLAVGIPLVVVGSLDAPTASDEAPIRASFAVSGTGASLELSF